MWVQKGDNEQYTGNLRKVQGVQEVCFSDCNGKIGCVVTVELGEYTGEEVVEKQEDGI